MVNAPKAPAAVQVAPDGRAILPAPVPADSVVALVSQTVINQRAFTNNCGIPMSAFVDFSSSEELKLPRVQGRQPLRCKSCAAFMNCYCKANLANSMWKCNLCGQANMAKDPLHPTVGNYPEMGNEAVEYVFALPAAEPAASTASVARPTGPPAAGAAGAAPAAPSPASTSNPNDKHPHIVLVIDATTEAEAMQNLCRAAMKTLRGLDPTTLLSVVSCDAVVNLHNLAQPAMDGSCRESPGGVYSHALPGGVTVEPAMLSFCMQLPGTKLVTELGKCLPHLETVLSSIRPLEKEKNLRERSRCLLVAVEAALRLSAANANIDPAHVRTKLPAPTRMLMMASGPITMGPGYVPLDVMDDLELVGQIEKNKAMQAAKDHALQLALMAGSLGMPIDVFIGGELSVNVPVLGLLAEESGGEMIAHDSFGPLFSTALSVALTRSFGTRGMLDCYVSEGVRLVQWMGPVDVLQPWPADEYSHLVSDRRLSGNACSVSNLQMGQGAAVRLELTKDLAVPAVYVQIVLQFIESSTGHMVQRVVMRRISVVSCMTDFIQGIRPAVAAVVTGKKLVLEAKRQNAMRDPKKAEDIRYSVSAQANLIAHRCGKEVQVSKGLLGFGARKAWAIPPELLPLSASLYNFQRSPCVRAWAMHPDERLYHMNTLLCAGGLTASLAMSPQLYLLEFEGHSTDRDEGSGGIPPKVVVKTHPIPCVNVAAHLYSVAGNTLLLDSGFTLMLLTPPEKAPTTPLPSPVLDPSRAMPKCEQVASAPPTPSTPTASGFRVSGGGSASRQNSEQLKKLASGMLSSELELKQMEAVVSLCEELAEGRFPVPELQILSANVEAYESFFMQSLVPIHRDSLEDQVLQFPALASLAVPDIRKLHEPLCSPIEEPSFLKWCRAAEVLPFRTSQQA